MYKEAGLELIDVEKNSRDFTFIREAKITLKQFLRRLGCFFLVKLSYIRSLYVVMKYLILTGKHFYLDIYDAAVAV